MNHLIVGNEQKLLVDYLKLKEKLLRLQNGDDIVKEENEIKSREDIFRNPSSKHHYIPRYFIDGFLDDDRLLFVYDKQHDRIKLNKQGSKGVFFEYDRNSTDFGFERPIALIEEAYSIFDNLAPASIKLLRSNLELSHDIRIELHAHLNTFLVDLYWRNINNDSLWDSLYENASFGVTSPSGVIPLSKDEIREWKQMPFFNQLMRYKMVAAVLEAIQLPEETNKTFTTNTITFPMKQLCIGDMPFLMSRKPTKHADLLNLPAFIPISSTKLYLRNISLKSDVTFRETCMLNAMIIEQSSKMICSGNKMVLDAAIAYYKLAKEDNQFQHYKDCVFNL
jgi:hypothetical protein